jgi:SAM-dependent methyltransferase
MTDTKNEMRLLDGLVDPLLAPLLTLPPGAHVVQLACGTGGLSLALARRRADLRITAIDIEPGVLRIARAAAADDDLTVDFRAMSMAGLDLGDGSADAVMSRMGLLMPGTAPFDVAAREAARILRPGGILSIATWTDLATSPYTGFGLPVLRRLLPEVPDFNQVFAASARPGALEGHLAAAGLVDVDASWFRWETEYPGFDAWWSFGTGFGPLKALFDSLDERQLTEARRSMADDLSAHRTESGSYRLPATCRLLSARR